MSVLKQLVNSSSDFSSFFSVITYNFSVNFYLMHFLLWLKGSHESTNFDTFKCADENLPNSWCHYPNLKSAFLQILHGSSVSLNITPQYFFRSNAVYFAQRDQSKCKFFRLFGPPIKMHLILVSFQTKNQFFFKFCTTLWYDDTELLHTF